MTRADWEAWRDRPRTPPEDVRLVPVTQENKAAVLALRTHHSQRAFVAPDARLVRRRPAPGHRRRGTGRAVDAGDRGGRR